MTAADVAAELDADLDAAAQAKADAIRRDHGPVPADLTEQVAALLTPQTTRRAS